MRKVDLQAFTYELVLSETHLYVDEYEYDDPDPNNLYLVQTKYVENIKKDA